MQAALQLRLSRGSISAAEAAARVRIQRQPSKRQGWRSAVARSRPRRPDNARDAVRRSQEADATARDDEGDRFQTVRLPAVAGGSAGVAEQSPLRTAAIRE